MGTNPNLAELLPPLGTDRQWESVLSGNQKSDSPFFFFFSFFSFLITKGRSENVLFHITNVFGFYSNGILRFLFSRENETEAIACIC